jgi:hypothetical protein
VHTRYTQQYNFSHTCSSDYIAIIREYNIVLYTITLYMISVLLWYTHELQCVMMIYINVLCIYCICYPSDEGPYIMILYNGNVTKLPTITIFGLINTHEFVINYRDVCSYAVIQSHNISLHILRKADVSFSHNFLYKWLSTF